jgi:hypothetical protein
MKFIIFAFIVISLFAQEKWISFKKSEKKEPINKNYQTDFNLSKPQSINILLQGAKILFPLIDKKTDTKKQNQKSEKKWFKIENIDID